MCSFTSKLRFKFAQLRNVLAAEDSAVMAQENKHHRMLRPQRTQANGISVAIGQGDAGKSSAVRGAHNGKLNYKALSRQPSAFSPRTFWAKEMQCVGHG
jgi:hypothetical protein